jgi:hypothetical protein
MSAQREARGIDVEADLGLKGVDGRELLFRPELLDELHFDLRTIEVAAEVEEMDFEAGNGTAGVDGGTEAEVEDGEVIGVTETDAGCVDAVGRKFEVGDVDVGGREAEGATELAAVGDGAGEGIGAAEEFGDVAEVAFAEGGSDAGRRDAFVADVDGGGLVGDKVDFAAEFAEQGDVAGAAVAELESVADGDRAQAAEAGGELADEALAIDLGQFPREVDGEDGVDAEGAEGPEALGYRLEQARGPVGEDDGERVRIEGHDHRACTEGSGVENGVADDVLVTQVNAVEHPQREADACTGAAEFGWITEETHAAGATRTA